MKKIFLVLVTLMITVMLAACTQGEAGLVNGTHEVEFNGAKFIVTVENGEISNTVKLGKYVDGEYTVSGTGKHGEILLDVEVLHGVITSIKTNSNEENEGLYLNAISIFDEVIEKNGHVGIDAFAGSTYSSNGILEAISTLPRTSGEVVDYVQVGSSDGEDAEFDLEWSVQPQLGLIKGNYFYEEEVFRQGHLGYLEVVTNDDNEIIFVEFNEIGRPNYYTKFYQDTEKRMSEYNFTMGAKKGAAWIQSVRLMEELILNENKLAFELNPNYDPSIGNSDYTNYDRLMYLGLDIVAGASNSVEQSLIPLAARIEEVREDGSEFLFYQYSEQLTGEETGLTAMLRFVVDLDGNIVKSYYDEIFADSKDEITDANLKKFYRQSKYQSVLFEEPARIGFNVTFDSLEEHLQAGGSMFDIVNLPATGASGDYSKTGFTKRNTAWENYLRLAEVLFDEMVNDGVIQAETHATINTGLEG